MPFPILSRRFVFVLTGWRIRQTRPIPSPAFNQDFRRNDVSPLQNRQLPEVDESWVTWSISHNGRAHNLHSFIGLSGGEIFHEMMLRQGVKHICECLLTHLSDSTQQKKAG